MLPPIVDLKGIERDFMGTQSVQVVPDDIRCDTRAIVVPACPAGQRWRLEAPETKEVEIAAEGLAVRSSAHIQVVENIRF